MPGENVLAVVLTNPPLTSGVRTTNRVEMARQLLNFASVTTANLFPHASKQSGDLSAIGTNWEDWLAARPALIAALQGASSVLLAYGVEEPAGVTRLHFRSQADWLLDEIKQRKLAVVQFGSRPLHPSRWQRHTYAYFPGVPFADAARTVLMESSSDPELD